MKKFLAVILSLMMLLPCCLVMSASAAAVAEHVYIDGINCYVNTYGTVLVYGEGQTANDAGMGSHDWWHKVIADFDIETGAFVVSKVYWPAGADFTYASVSLASNQVMIMTHAGAGDTAESFHVAMQSLSEGDKLYAYGFDFTNATEGALISGGVSDVYFTTVEPLDGNGYYGYVEPPKPNITSLGAKANTELAGIRFGTEYKSDVTLGEVTQLGTLLIPEAKLGSDKLTLDLDNPQVVNVEARTIDPADFIDGKAFEQYESFTYYVTVIGLDGHEADNIVARSYITYSSNAGVNTVYADAISRNINEVVAAAE